MVFAGRTCPECVLLHRWSQEVWPPIARAGLFAITAASTCGADHRYAEHAQERVYGAQTSGGIVWVGPAVRSFAPCMKVNEEVVIDLLKESLVPSTAGVRPYSLELHLRVRIL